METTDDTAGGTMSRARVGIATGAALVLVVAFAAIAIWQGRALHTGQRDQRREDAAVTMAKAQVVDLTSLDSTSVHERIARMTKRTSGSFQQELTDMTKAFAAAVTKSKIKSTGTIDAAAVSAYTGSTAEVIVASTADVASAQTTTPVSRAYRMKVSLAWSKTGWLIKGMEFVS